MEKKKRFFFFRSKEDYVSDLIAGATNSGTTLKVVIFFIIIYSFCLRLRKEDSKFIQNSLRIFRLHHVLKENFPLYCVFQNFFNILKNKLFIVMLDLILNFTGKSWDFLFLYFFLHIYLKHSPCLSVL